MYEQVMKTKSTLQRKLKVTEVPVINEKAFESSNKGEFKPFMKKMDTPELSDEQANNAGLSKYEAIIDKIEIAIYSYPNLKREITEYLGATDVHYRVIPDHLLDVKFGEDDDTGAINYSKKNIGDKLYKYIDDSSKNVDAINLTNDSMSEADGGSIVENIKEEQVSGRRKPLNIANYSEIRQKIKNLNITKISGIGLMKQFALALKKVFASKAVNTEVPSPATELKENLKTNYDRLEKAFEDFKTDLMEKNITLVLGYQSSFESNIKGETVTIKKITSNGWTAHMYFSKTKNDVIVSLDSDINHSYHVEVLAENIKKFLSSTSLTVANIFVGGSAGSLLAHGDTTDESHHKHNSLVTPSEIETTQKGETLNNVLHTTSSSNPALKHKSVLSVLTESSPLLKSLKDEHFGTVDMEFGYLAKVIKEFNESNKEKAINYGVGLLITDYPNAKSTAALDHKADKKVVLRKFVELVVSKIGSDIALTDP